MTASPSPAPIPSHQPAPSLRPIPRRPVTSSGVSPSRPHALAGVWDGISIASTGVFFPSTVSVDTVLADEHYPRRRAKKSRQLAVAVAPPVARTPDFAVAAARQALERVGCAPSDIGLLIYTYSLHPGVDGWNSASYVQDQVATAACRAADMRNGCEGTLAALELASSHLQVRAQKRCALIVSADSWPAPYIDRWNADSTAVFGDGGTALLLSRDGGFARVAAMSTVTDPSLEGLDRGDEPFGPFRHGVNHPIDFRRRGHEFMRRMADPQATGDGVSEEVARRITNGAATAVKDALTHARISQEDIDHFVLPFCSYAFLERTLLTPLGIDEARTTFEFSRSTGHLGPGDAVAGLNALIEARRLRRGHRVLIVSISAGAVWTALVVETIADPPQPVSRA